MNIKAFQGGYDKNFSYVIWCEETKHAALIDASTEINPIIEYIEDIQQGNNLKVMLVKFTVLSSMELVMLIVK